MDLIWRSEKKIKFGDFYPFAPIAPNFFFAKSYPNNVFCVSVHLLIKLIVVCSINFQKEHTGNLTFPKSKVHLF